MSTWNKKNFSIYTSDERSALGLIEELGNQTNYNTEELKNKTDVTGNHLGSWQGLERPTLSEEGMRSVVEQLQEISYLMPEPTNVEGDTKTLQKILDKAKNGKCKITVYFRSGNYLLNDFTIYSNTTLELKSDTILTHVRTNHNIFISNVKINDNDEASKITGYNGNSNINIYGGIINAYCSFVFMHGQNINVIGTKFIETKSDHIFQIGGCKNVKIKNCVFEGMKNPSSERQYVEMIQIDYMTYKALPYWNESNPIFDHTLNDGIYVTDCKFNKGGGSYEYLTTPLGSHSNDENRLNKNIHFERNEVNYCSYGAFSFNNMENVVIRDNIVKGYGNSCNLFRGTNAKNVLIDNNKIESGFRSILVSQVDGIIITNLFVNNIVNVSDYLLIGESNRVILNNISFKNCIGANYILLNRNNYDVIITNLSEVNCVANNDYFIRCYVTNELTNDLVQIKNITTTKQVVSISNTTNVISDYVTETIYNCSEPTNNIKLIDSIKKFTNLVVTLNWYGDRNFMMNEVRGGYQFTEINIADNGEEPKVAYLEFFISKVDDFNLEITRNVQLNNDGNINSVVTSDAYVKRIKGNRIKY